MVEHENADTTATQTSFKLDKNILRVESDPLHHGFWSLSLAKGALPTAFRGRYTKRNAAIRAAQEYIALKTKE
jgi:hypothetical protein